MLIIWLQGIWLPLHGYDYSETPLCDLRTEVLDVIAEGDRVAIRSRLSDGSGELFELLRINKGPIAELWGARTS